MQDLSVLCLSTAHLSHATTSFLAATDCMDWPVVGGPFRDMGWFFHVDEDLANDDDDADFSDLKAAFKLALAMDRYLVLFDISEEPCAALPLYRDVGPAGDLLDHDVSVTMDTTAHVANVLERLLLRRKFAIQHSLHHHWVWLYPTA